MRRFLVLTPVVLAVNTVLLVVYSAITSGLSLLQTGIALLVALAATAAVLAVILVAVGVLGLLGVRSAWAALGLAFGLFVVVLGIIYAAIAASMPPGDEGWNLVILVGAAGASVPTWLAYTAGLLIGDRRNRARNQAAQDRAAQDGGVSPTA